MDAVILAFKDFYASNKLSKHQKKIQRSVY